MLKHVVMWRFREGADGRTRREHAQWMKEHLEALRGVIPQIREMEVGVNENPSPEAFDAVLTAVFDSPEELAIYKAHPAHVAVSDCNKRVRESRVVVDYTL